VICAWLLPAFGQQAPIIQEGPINAASYAPMGLPSGGIAQGSMFILKGGGLGACGTVIASSFPLQANMAALQIRVTVAGTTINARMIYVVACRTGAPDQVAAILPSNVPVGTGTLQVITNLGNVTRTSPTVPIRVVANSFGMFTRNQNGKGPAIVQNFISATETPTNGLLESAQVGQVGILWGTGLGAVNPVSEINGPVPGDLPLNVEVWTGGKKATVTYRGRSGCCAGIDQIVFTVPPGLNGCYVSVIVRVNGVTSVAGTMSIASGKTCNEPTRISAADMAKIQKAGTIAVGDIIVNRNHVNMNIPGIGVIQGDLDSGEGHLRKYASSADVMAAMSGTIAGYTGSPTPGSCVILSYPLSSGDDAFGAVTPDVPDFIGTDLDTGPSLRLNGVKGIKLLPKQLANDGSVDGYYLTNETFLGGGLAALGIPVTPLYLEPGALTVDNGAGTAQVGAFTSNLTIPVNPATWTSQTPGSTLPLTQDITVTWSGGGAGELVAVTGSSAARDIAAGAEFVCVERATVGSLTVPAWIVSALPPSGVVDGVNAGFMTFATTLAQPSRFSATGLDLGYFNWGLIQLKNVVFQ
jgi:uncharacterized protein (TIGR03437 family)